MKFRGKKQLVGLDREIALCPPAKVAAAYTVRKPQLP